ncbi:MAG: YhjD/YihY/BrkB family envelope integrity protein [Bdellovibrionia bacterium]
MAFFKRIDARTFYSRIERDRLFDHAASLTYTTILSLIPMLAMAYSIFTAFGAVEKYRAQFEKFVGSNLAPAFAEQVLGYVTSIQRGLSAETLGVFGFVGFLVTSVLMLDKIESAFNSIWGAVQPRPMIRRFTNYWTLISIGPILLGASLAITARAIGWLESDSGDLARALVFLATFVVPYVFSAVLFFALFYILPNAGIHRRDAIVSALCTALVFEVAKQGYAVYAAHALRTSVYGSLSTLPVFFLWIYVVWMITLLGFEFCCYLEAARMKWAYLDDEEFTLDTLLMLDILEATAATQNTGQGADLKDLVKRLNVNRRILLKHLEFLKTQGLIVQTEPNARDGHFYHLAFGRVTLDHGRLLEVLEKARFRPVGPATKAVASAQLRALRAWNLADSEESPAQPSPNTTPPSLDH